MPPILHMIAMLPAMAASCLISAIWQGLVLAICVTLCLHLLPETTAAIRSHHLVGCICAGHRTSPREYDDKQSVPSPGGARTHDPPRLSLGRGDRGSVGSVVAGSRIAACDGALRLRRIANGQRLLRRRCAEESPGRTRRHAELCTSSDVDSPSVIGFMSPRILIPAALVGEAFAVAAGADHCA